MIDATKLPRPASVQQAAQSKPDVEQSTTTTVAPSVDQPTTYPAKHLVLENGIYRAANRKK